MKRTISTFLFILFPLAAYSLDCPKMPEQTNKDWDVEVKAAVGKIGPVQGAELQTKTKSAVTDLMGKLPQADKIYLQQMFYATYCSGLRDDKSLTESEKAKLIRTYNMEVQNALFGPTPKKKLDKQGAAPLQSPEDARLALSKLSLPYTGRAFLERVQENDTYAAKLFLAAGMNPNQSTDDGITALMYAVRNNNRELIKTLMEKGANVNERNNRAGTALDWAAARGMTDVVDTMLAKGPSVEIIESAVASAAASGRKDTLKLLLDKGGNTPHALSKALQDASGSTYLAVKEQDFNEVVRLLLDHKADIESESSSGMTPLMLAAAIGKSSVVRTLVDAGALVNAKSTCVGREGSTALIMAVKEKHEDIAKVLINRGADCTIVNDHGETALTHAAEHGSSEIVGLLVDKGVDLNRKDHKGQTALMIAAKRGNKDAVRVLIERGAAVHEKDDRGNTAYSYALQLGQNDGRRAPILQLLEAAGAN